MRLALLGTGRRRSLVAACAALLLAASAQAQLPGFTLAGEDWTYDPGDGGSVISGKLIQPTTGEAPHPAVIISHGQGGNAQSFGAQKAAVMRTWGLVCIAPNYTHVDGDYPPDSDGWSPENERRARACLTILASRPDVDVARIGAYGNSKGAFVTAGLCGAAQPGEIRAAAITAGGTSGTSDASLPSPAVQEVAGIRAPFLMLHGGVDRTVDPEQSETLAEILASLGVPHARFVWGGIDHQLHAARESEVNVIVRAWFSEHGVLGDAGNTPPVLGPIADVSGPANATLGPIEFTVGDDRTSAGALDVNAFSLDVALLPSASVVPGGAGADRTVTLTPAANATGRATVVAIVDDGELAGMTSFRAVFGSGTQLAFCAGDGIDPEVSTPCPCANHGGPGRGCAHSANVQGARLSGSGSTQPDTLVLAASGMPPAATCIFLQGDERTDAVFGDGVRCTGGTLLRLRARTAVASASQYPQAGDPSLSVRGGVAPGSGDVRYYQAYYRNAATGYCPPATFNVTNGWMVTW